jgi:Dolichyl-phosphate-mannose-protein mannosyltransferase
MTRVRRPALIGAVLGLLVFLGFASRLAIANQSLFADELSTYWIVSTNDGLGDLLRTVHSNAEISPPLSFVLGWLSTRIDLTAELLRLPSLLAGTLTIPMVYLLGARTVGRAAGLLAAALTTLSPFMTYYSAEARGYAVMMFFVVASTLTMLIAVDRGGWRWWAAYAAASLAAMYTHYTSVFVLAAQFSWVIWAHPAARRPALLASVAAAVAYLPWIDGLLRDLRSPTTDILSFLQPFELTFIRNSFEHWAIGYPFGTVEGSVALSGLPGFPAAAMIGAGVLLALWGVWRTRAGALRWEGPERMRRLALLAALAAAVPAAGIALGLLGGTHILSTRNLAASWPGYALTLSGLVAASGTRVRLAAAGLLVIGFGVGAVKMHDPDNSRPQYAHAADFVLERAEPGAVVIDETAVLSPGPLSGIDPHLDRRLPSFRSESPQQSKAPFSVFDRKVPSGEAARNAARAASGRRVFLVRHTGRGTTPRPPRGYRLTERRGYPGFRGVVVRVYDGR